MKVDIRSYIKDNFKNSSIQDIKDSIMDSIKDADELTLPGLGVFFEIIWQNSNDIEKNNILNMIKDNLN